MIKEMEPEDIGSRKPSDFSKDFGRTTNSSPDS